MIKEGPEVWGPAAWQFLEAVAFRYFTNPTPEEKEQFMVFFDLLKFVLPCGECAEHYAEEIEKNPIRVDSRFELVIWLLEIHNSVNKRNGKRHYSLTEFMNKNEITLQDLLQ